MTRTLPALDDGILARMEEIAVPHSVLFLLGPLGGAVPHPDGAAIATEWVESSGGDLALQLWRRRKASSVDICL